MGESVIESCEEEDGHATFLEYHGAAGGTDDCIEAVERLLHSRREFAKCVILTCEVGEHPTHALYLVDVVGDEAVVKDGFGAVSLKRTALHTMHLGL